MPGNALIFRPRLLNEGFRSVLTLTRFGFLPFDRTLALSDWVNEILAATDVLRRPRLPALLDFINEEAPFARSVDPFSSSDRIQASRPLSGFRRAA
jgi:hypothetical protein